MALVVTKSSSVLVHVPPPALLLAGLLEDGGIGLSALRI